MIIRISRSVEPGNTKLLVNNNQATPKRARNIRLNRAATVLLAVFFGSTIAPTLTYAGSGPCGGKGERACCCFGDDRCCSPSIFCGDWDDACDSGLKEITIPVCGAGVAPDACGGCSSSWCSEPTTCGGDGQRACCSSATLSNGKSCKDGFIEDFTDEGSCPNKLGAENCACETGTFLSSGTCRNKKGVGESCNLITTCEDGLICRVISLSDSICMAELDDAVSAEECLTFFDRNILDEAVTNGVPFNDGEQGVTLSYGLGVSGAIGVTESLTRGVVYGRDGCFGCYETVCSGLELAIGYAGVAELGRSNTPMRCPDDMVCDGDRNTTCTSNAGCDSDDFCASYICTNRPTQSCKNDTECPGSGTCRRCNTFDGEGFVEYVSFSTGIEVLGVTETLSFANFPEDILDPQPGEDSALVGSGESISIGIGVSFPVSPGVAFCTTIQSVVGCLDTSGNFIEDVSNQPPTCSFTSSPSLTATCSTQSSPSFTLTSTSSDPDGDTLSYQWSSNCSGSSFTTGTSASTSMTVGWPMCANCTVSLRISDGTNSVICSPIAVDYIDSAKPTISPSASNMTVECDGGGNSSQLTNWTNSHGGASATDACSSVMWNNNVSSLSNGCGATGSASGTFTATDTCGNNRSTSATFTVQDTTNPSISCPTSPIREVSSPGQCTLAVNYSVTASDACGFMSLGCVDQNGSSVGTSGDTFPVGTTTVTCTATDQCSLTSNCSFDIVVNDPPVIVSVTPATQTVQYSDKIVKVIVTATDCGPSTSLTLDFALGDVPSSLLLSADPCGVNAGLTECKWTLRNNDRVLEPEGDYVIDNIKALDPTPIGGVTLTSSAKTITVQVKAENATIKFDSGNPVAVQVATDGGDSGTFELKVDVRELNPELDSAGGNLPGDIGLAVVSMTLAPIGPGGGAVATCTPDNNPNPLDYSVLTVTCSFNNVGVNTYTAQAVLVAHTPSGDLFYVGSNEDVLVVFDPSLGFTTGGGHFDWPGTDQRTNWGYTMKYNRRRTKIQGSLLLIRHLSNGTKYRIKSNKLFGLAIGDEDNFGWATFAGKCNYRDPSMDVPVGNHAFVTYVEDYGEPGAGSDKFWLQVFDMDGVLIGDLSMDETAVSNAETIVGGNIVVPHGTSGTR